MIRSVSAAILELSPWIFVEMILTADSSSNLTARCGAEFIDQPVKVTLLSIWYKFRKPATAIRVSMQMALPRCFTLKFRALWVYSGKSFAYIEEY